MLVTLRCRVDEAGRQIGESWFHEDDFGVECKGAFFGFVAFAVVAIALVPVGVPVLLFFFMRRKKIQINLIAKRRTQLQLIRTQIAKIKIQKRRKRNLEIQVRMFHRILRNASLMIPTLKVKRSK